MCTHFALIGSDSDSVSKMLWTFSSGNFRIAEDHGLIFLPSQACLCKIKDNFVLENLKLNFCLFQVSKYSLNRIFFESQKNACNNHSKINLIYSNKK